MPLMRITIALIWGAFISASALAQSAAYPDHVVRIVVPFPAGGTNDVLARQLAFHLEASLKQPFIVDNRPGSGGSTGAAAVARSAPDGHTILLTSVNYAVTASLYRELPFDARKDLIPVSQLTDSTLVLIASAKLSAASLDEIVALAKSKPGAMNYGSTGPGSVLELAMELFKIRTGTDIVEVPYRGDAAVIEALLRNDVQLAVTALTVALPYIQSRQVRAIAVTGGKRTPVLPELKTMEEAGIADFSIGGWHGFLMPAGTDSTKVDLIQQETAKALATPQLKQFLAQNGLVGVGSTSGEFSRKLNADMQMFATIIHDAKIKQID